MVNALLTVLVIPCERALVIGLFALGEREYATEGRGEKQNISQACNVTSWSASTSRVEKDEMHAQKEYGPFGCRGYRC